MPFPPPPRPEQLLWPAQRPVPPRKAASVIFVRPNLAFQTNPSAADYEILLTQRTNKASFAPSAWVFAGGCIDEDDALDGKNQHQINALPTIGLEHLPHALHSAARAALREAFEELGLLCVARTDNGQVIQAGDFKTSLEDYQNNPQVSKNLQPIIQSNNPAQKITLYRHAPLAPQLRAAGWALDARTLTPLCRWVADPQLPRRFDTWFFLAPAPAGQVAQPDGREQVAAQWLTVAAALAEHAAGRLPMIFPTVRTLQHLAAWPRFNELTHAAQVCCQDIEIKDNFDEARRQTLTQPRPKTPFSLLGDQSQKPPLGYQTMPRSGLVGGQTRHFTEDEPGWGELALRNPSGAMAQHTPPHALDWQSTQPVALRRNLLRLTAPNAGVMTGPGTNTYLVGQALGGWLVIDPGPDDEAHLQRIITAAWAIDENSSEFKDFTKSNAPDIPRGIRAIVCTHSHPDHASGARRLQAMCADYVKQNKHLAESSITAPILGMASGPHSRAHSRFVPDVAMADGQSIEIEGVFPPARHTLRAIHTPGHAANHLCLWLQQDGIVFTGDHVMGTGSPVIAPRDGHMGTYIESLNKLKDLCQAQGVQFLLPAHGWAIHAPQQSIDAFITHRLRRHARVVQAVRAQPDANLAQWLDAVYGRALPEALRRVARASLLAHLQWMDERAELPAAFCTQIRANLHELLTKSSN